MLNYIKDRFLRRRIERDEREIKIGFTVSALLIVALLANVIFLNLFIINSVSSKSSEPIAVIATPAPFASIATPTPTSGATSAAQIAPDKSTVVPSSYKDYYVNLGSGSNQSTDWTDVAGTLVTIDLGLYQNIKEVHLESTINVPTANGTISVRLFNKTGNYAVWNSERTVQAQSNGDLLISQSLIYDVGAKFYQVQMKSQFGVPANLLQARLHVVAQ